MVKLYKLDPSPPARAAMMLLDVLKVQAEYVDVNLLEGAHLKPEYLKKNPLHTVPVLEDGDVILHDSHAILMYVADKYGKNDSLYPKDVAQRAMVNQKLFFNSAILFTRLRNVTFPLIIEGSKQIPDKLKKDILDAYGFLEEFLARTKYLAGNNITIADIAAIASVTSLFHLVPHDAGKYPKTNAWVAEMTSQSYAKKCNAPGNVGFAELVKNALA